MEDWKDGHVKSVAVYSIYDHLFDYLAFLYTYFIVFCVKLFDNENKISKRRRYIWERSSDALCGDGMEMTG